MDPVDLMQHSFQALAVAYIQLPQNNQLDSIILEYLLNTGTTKWPLSNALM